MADSRKKTKVGEEVKTKTVGYITAGLGLVASLAWNEAIKGLIAITFPQEQNTLLAKFVYALAVTLIVALAGLYTARLVREQHT